MPAGYPLGMIGRKRVVQLGIVLVSGGIGSSTICWLGPRAALPFAAVAGLVGIVAAVLYGRDRTRGLRWLALAGPIVAGAAIGVDAVRTVAYLASNAAGMGAFDVTYLWGRIAMALMVCWGTTGVVALAMAHREAGARRRLWALVAAEWIVLALLAVLHVVRLESWARVGDPSHIVIGAATLGGVAVAAAVGAVALGVAIGLGRRTWGREGVWLAPIGAMLTLGAVGVGSPWAARRIAPVTVAQARALPVLPGVGRTRSPGPDALSRMSSPNRQPLVSYDETRRWPESPQVEAASRRGRRPDCRQGAVPTWVAVPAQAKVADLARLVKRAMSPPGHCPLLLALRPTGPAPPASFGWVRWTTIVQWIGKGRAVEVEPTLELHRGPRHLRLLPHCKIQIPAFIKPWKDQVYRKVFVDESDDAASLQRLLVCWQRLAPQARLYLVPGRWGGAGG